jgi:tRNA-splicing ligase RtcB (3'-phosphate/5'-hydroxy nucleic acid ligase)
MTRNYDLLTEGFEPAKNSKAMPVKMWTRGVPVDESSMQQLHNTASMPFIHKWIAVMPDVHYGKGSTIGSVIPTVGAIIPAAVGVDIGCGMMAVRTSLVASDLPDTLLPLRTALEKAVPHGRTVGRGGRDKGSWNELPEATAEGWKTLDQGFAAIVAKHPKLAKANTANHLGTLGTGNHFLEVCLDQENRVWFMLHSGSRGVGNTIGTYFIEKAKQDMRRWYINLPDADLAYFPERTVHFND